MVDETRGEENVRNEFLKEIRILCRRLISLYPLYLVFVFLTLIIFVFMYILVKPTYTAIAIIGPPNPSPTTSLMSGLSGGLGRSLSGAQKLMGGGGSENDPFQEYLQLLYSARLANELVEKDHILPLLFDGRWDAANKRWREPSVLHKFVSPIKRTLNRPVSDYPNANTLQEFLRKKMKVSPSTSFALSILASSGYMDVSLSVDGRTKAEDILRIILNRTDDIVRQERLRDVKARIAYINEELPKVTQAEQHSALIQTLSSQEELKTMLVADQRYASTMVDMPKASAKPTSPMSPSKAILLSLIISFICLLVIIKVSERIPWVKNGIDRFSVCIK